MSYYSSRRGERSNRSAPPCFDQNDAYYNSQPLEPRPNFGYPPKETLMVSRPQARGTPPPETGRGIASRNDYYRDNTREYHDEKKEHAPDSYFQETYGRSKRYEDLAKQQEADIKAYNSSGRKLSKKARRGLEELGPEYRVSGDPPETRDWHNRGTVLHEQAIDTYSNIAHSRRATQQNFIGYDDYTRYKGHSERIDNCNNAIYNHQRNADRHRDAFRR